MNLAQLYAELRKKTAEARAARTAMQETRKAGKENSVESEEALFKLLDEAEEIRARIVEEEELRQNDLILNGQVNEKAHENREGRQNDEYRKAFNEYLRNGGSTSRETFKKLNEYRAMNTTDKTNAGYLVDTTTLTQVAESKFSFGAMFNAARKLKTQSGNPIQWAVSQEGITRGVIIGEGENHGKTDTKVSNQTLGAHKISSQIILVSDEILQDAYIDVASYVTQIARRRVTLGIDYYIINGKGGSTEPSGLLIQIPSNRRVTVTLPTDATSQAYYSAVYDGFVDVIHVVDAAYRVGLNYKIACNDKTVAKLKKWKDADGNPIYVRDVKADWPESIFGWPLLIDNNLPDLGTNGAVIAGDFDALVVREAGDMVVKRFDELYAETGQVGFLAWQRFGVILEDLAAFGMMDFSTDTTHNLPESNEQALP